MAQTMEHRHQTRLYKCAECEFSVSHELMVYVLRHFFKCTSNKYVDELEVWSPPQLKIHGTTRKADQPEDVVRERHPSARQEEDSRTPANPSDHRRVSQDNRSFHLNSPHQKGVQNLSDRHCFEDGRTIGSEVTKVTETADSMHTGLQGAGIAMPPPMVWMVQPNTNTQQPSWHKNSSSAVTTQTQRPKPIHRQSIQQEGIHIVSLECNECQDRTQDKHGPTQAERGQAQHNSQKDVVDLCIDLEEEDEDEEAIGLHLSCSPVPGVSTGDLSNQVVAMATSSAGMNMTQTPSILQQQHQLQNLPFDRLKRGRPQKPPYSNVADMEQPKNTKRMNRWAVRVLNSWADRRNREMSATSSDQDQKLIPTNWSAMTVEQLDHWLSQFVSEVRRDDGQYYPYNTLYLMFTGINRYLRNDCDRKDVNILAKDDPRFLKLREAMETKKKLLIDLGIGLQDKRRHDMEPFPFSVEARLWESKVFSLEKDLGISYAVFYYTYKLFCVTSGEEHHSLVAEQFSVGCDHVGRYVEFNSAKKNKTMKVYAVQSDPYCPVLLYEVYLGYIPPTGPLYRRLQTDPEGRMYFGPPVGKNALATYFSTIKKLGGLNPQGNTGPHPTSSSTAELSQDDSPATSSSDSAEGGKRLHSLTTDGSEGSAEPSPKRIHTWNLDHNLSSYTALNQSSPT